MWKGQVLAKEGELVTRVTTNSRQNPGQIERNKDHPLSLGEVIIIAISRALALPQRLEKASDHVGVTTSINIAKHYHCQ